jgi:hypothetical protein
MADIVVKYNGVTLSPTPLVQQSYDFIDYGSRWGNITQIELNGVITGFTSALSVQTGFANNFTGQFGTLEVLDGVQTMYKWNNVILDEIVFPPNHLFLGTAPRSLTPYTAKMKVINVPSGVVDPVNEYSFAQGEDGIVTVNHKVSARGIRTNTYGLANAVNFVQNFRGANPFSAQLAATFNPSGSGILASFTESVDRTTSSYSINEVYKYNTGLFNPYVEVWSINTNDLMDNEWLTVDVDWKVQGSPVNNNVLAVEASLTTNNPIQKLASIGYNTGFMVQAMYNATRDTGAATINIKASYLSGSSMDDILGYFDYVVNLSHDGTLPKEDWRIDGEFICFGPLEYRRSRLNTFKTASGSNGDAWRNMLTVLIMASPIYTTYHNPIYTFGGHSDLDIHEVTGLGQLRLSLSTTDGGHPSAVRYPKYTLEIEPNKWNYDLMPSANIEGHYVLQDLQMQSQGKINLTVEAQTKNPVVALPVVSGYLNSLSTLYVGTGFITTESYNTGMIDLTYQRSWLGLDNMSSGLLATKVAGSTLTDYHRKAGFKFGY